MADDVVTDLGKALAAWPGLLVKKAMMLADARDTVCMLNAARQKYNLFSLQSRRVVLYSTSGCNLHPNWLLLYMFRVQYQAQRVTLTYLRIQRSGPSDALRISLVWELQRLQLEILGCTGFNLFTYCTVLYCISFFVQEFRIFSNG